MIQHHPVDELRNVLDHNDHIVPGCIVELLTEIYRSRPGEREFRCSGRGLVVAVVQGEIPPDKMVATVLWHEFPKYVYVPAIPVDKIRPTINIEDIRKRRFKLR